MMITTLFFLQSFRKYFYYYLVVESFSLSYIQEMYSNSLLHCQTRLFTYQIL